MGRKRKTIGWRARALGVLALAAMLGGAWGWWQLRHWTPDLASYPDQGAEVSAGDGAVHFKTLKALGAQFVYLEASQGDRRDPAFAANLSAAREAGLKVGAVHRFDPCIMADGQSARFVVIVPRGGDLLPPTIALDRIADECPAPVGEAEVESELMTLINQIETHAGRPVILKLSPAFQDRHNTATTLARDLWLARDRARPDYAGRPWLLWSANSALVTEASEEPVEWVVVQK